MHKAERQQGQAQHQPAAKQGNGAALESPQGGHIAQLEALANSGPHVEKQAQLAAMINASPTIAAQRRLDMIHNSPRQMKQQASFDAIHNSPRQTAQRKQFDSLLGTAQRVPEEELPAQPRLVSEAPAQLEQQPAQLEATERKPNNTGLPDNLKSGIESLSGMSMDNVRVHYNSSQPAQLNALAYAQGTDIHVAPGQEKHLPHEAWHVVQQAQGRVRPTMQMKSGVPVNDDKGLEHEADVMGRKAFDSGTAGVGGKGFAPFAVLQAVFSQTTPGLQTHVHGGVTSNYDIATNTADLHIAAGANAAGNLMADFLIALWEIRDTIVAGQTRNPLVPGGVEMHPGGSQVLKMTMEMLGEAVGQAPHVQTAQTLKGIRQTNNLPLGAGIPAAQINDVLDSTIVPEHRAYRDSLVGVAGITMNPVGGGTSGGTVDMLHGAGAAAERTLYDTALATLRPFMSINVTITLPVLQQVIAMMEGKLSFFQKLALKAKYMLNN
jgi:hypothetical protein